MIEGKYWDDLNIGDRFATHGRTITEADLVRFNGITWNTEPVHNDREWVRGNTEFKDRLVPGLFTMALAIGLDIQTGEFRGKPIALLGFENVRFTNPLYPGDNVHAEIEIAEKRETQRNDRGVVKMRYTVKNQDGSTLAEFTRIMLWRRKPAS